jgi:hypothetical protein
MEHATARARTDQKIAYAAVLIREICDSEHATTNDTWENAHQESCFFHLAGAVDAILHEISAAYSLGLGLRDVDWGRVGRSLGETGQHSPAFVLLVKTKRRRKQWLDLLYEWRNHGAHRARVSKIVYASMTRVVDNQFKDPRTGEVPSVFAGMGSLEVLQVLEKNVRDLLGACRETDPKLGNSDPQ